MTAALVLLFALVSQAAEYAAPAGVRPAFRRPGGSSILPGGRVVIPTGVQYVTGPGPYALAMSPSGKTIVTANPSPERFSLTVLERDKTGHRQVRHMVDNGGIDDWRGVSTGVAFDGERTVYVSEGASGRIWAVNPSDGSRRRAFDLNQDGVSGSFTGDLAFDPERKLLYVLDRANSRFVAVDVVRRRVSASLRLDGTPVAMSVSPDRRRVCIIIRKDASSVAIVSLDNPTAPALAASIRIGQDLAGVLATADRVFVSDIVQDVVFAIDAKTNKVISEAPLRIQSLENLRGVEPRGLAFHPATGWLLVAESGANAVGVVDTAQMKLIGHIPTGWAPGQILIDADSVYVTNNRGHGIGPNTGAPIYDESFLPTLGRGSVTTFPLPSAAELAKMTEQVMFANGYIPKAANASAPVPEGIRHVVLIMKGNRSFDDVLGDLGDAGNGPVMALASLARHGRSGYADGQNIRLSLQRADITPNHHQIAGTFSFSDNFYADNGSSAGTRWAHIEHQGVSVLNMALAGADRSDQTRASAFIRALQENYGEGKKALPQLVLLRLPNDRMNDPRPSDGFTYGASYIADNDLALGRIVEFLSHTPWWRQMAIFITEEAAYGGYDHIDAHRTILLCAGPYFKRNYVSHVNASLPGLLKTIFRILGLPPLSLFDATASDLSDTFTATPDFTPYTAVPVDKRVFDPAKLLEAAR